MAMAMAMDEQLLPRLLAGRRSYISNPNTHREARLALCALAALFDAAMIRIFPHPSLRQTAILARHHPAISRGRRHTPARMLQRRRTRGLKRRTRSTAGREACASSTRRRRSGSGHAVSPVSPDHPCLPRRLA